MVIRLKNPIRRFPRSVGLQDGAGDHADGAPADAHGGPVGVRLETYDTRIGDLDNQLEAIETRWEIRNESSPQTRRINQPGC